MPKPDSTVTGGPVWIDLSTTDADASQAFYRGLFGWESEAGSPEFGGYFSFLRNGEQIAGGMPAQPGMPDFAVPNGWAVYLRTADAEKTAATAAEHGGKVLAPPMPVGDLGVMSIVADPGGAVIGMWEPGVHTGFHAVNEEGAPAWFELLTRDYQASVPFYRDVFGWNTQTMSDTDEFRYTVLVSASGAPVAGIMDAGGFLPADAPVAWSVYFGVTDTDAALEKVASLGGRSLREPEDTPYGRLATAADSNGATFNLMGPNRSDPSITPLA
jgi:predicted enzyme related to lactoylglutathione lyase